LVFGRVWERSFSFLYIKGLPKWDKKNSSFLPSAEKETATDAGEPHQEKKKKEVLEKTKAAGASTETTGLWGKKKKGEALRPGRGGLSYPTNPATRKRETTVPEKKKRSFFSAKEQRGKVERKKKEAGFALGSSSPWPKREKKKGFLSGMKRPAISCPRKAVTPGKREEVGELDRICQEWWVSEFSKNGGG